MTDIELALVHYDGDNSKPYCDLVYEALKEKQRREKGCSFCMNDHSVKYNDIVVVDGMANGRLGSRGVCCAKFCPACGRKLTP